MEYVLKMWALTAINILFAGVFDWHPLLCVSAGASFGSAWIMTLIEVKGYRLTRPQHKDAEK